jgi:hypothetical protein
MNLWKPVVTLLAGLLCVASASVVAGGAPGSGGGAPNRIDPGNYPGWMGGEGRFGPNTATLDEVEAAEELTGVEALVPGFGHWGPKDAGKNPGAPWSRPPGR